MLRKVCSLLFALIVMTFATIQSTDKVYAALTDIPAKYASEINYLIEQEIIFGYPDDTFKPKNAVTRQEAATMIGRSLDLENNRQNTKFPDVTEEHYASGYIASAAEKGIISGYADGTFHPNEKVTRAQMATLLARAFDLNETSSHSFTDVAKSAWYYTPINKVATAEITVGYPDGTFKPSKDITREEFSVLMARAMDGNVDSVSQDPKPEPEPDLTETVIGEQMVTTDGLNVRKGPGTSYDVVGNFSDGQEVKVHEEDGSWRYVSGNGVEGYVHSAYLADIPKPVIAEKIVTTDNLNVRKGPGISYDVVGKYSDNQEVDVHEVDGDWRLVSGNGVEGYVHSAYLADIPKPVIAEKIVTTDTLNVRKGPGTSYDVVGQFTTGEAVDVHKEEGSWRLVSSGSVEGYVHEAYLTDKPNVNRTVAIDPGHGGKDPGAVANGLVEKEVVLDVSLKVREYLRDSGINVVMTRSSDWYPTLDGRVNIANQNNADSFVSVHANAFLSSANGVETFYYAKGMTDREYKSYKLAGYINERLHKSMDMTDRGVKNAGYRVIKATNLPAVLTEIGFLTNDEDAAKLKTQKYRDEAAKAIAMGIIDYYNWRE
ncbi:N-acetylmuramoyl-L-alanine amidase [Halobacillus sp. B29]|uniref:N-acetylmuramoyl-L-alanine amidase n=1 Tax=Halobacillus sp. B29 TaxID=3457432 RepID=UPI003FCE6C28